MKISKIAAIFIPLLFATGLFAEQQFSPTICSFNTGYVCPFMETRTDYDKYKSSCRTLENMFVMSQGPATRRPGTKYIATAKDSNYPVRLIPFERSTEDAYVIEVGDFYMRFFRDGGQVLTGSGTEDLSGLSDLIANWRLNEFEGTVVFDEVGDHNGVASINIATLTADGYVGTGCFDFNDQYAVEVNDSNDFSFTDDANDTPFSVTSWIYVTDSPQPQAIVSKWKKDSQQEWRFILTEDEKLKLELCNQGEIAETNSVNCVAQYNLNDDAASTAVVDSARDNNGVATANTSTLTTTGMVGEAFSFDGTTTAVEVNDADIFSFAGDVPFSISAWVFIDNYGGAIVSKCDSASAQNTAEYLLYVYAGGNLQLTLYAHLSQSVYIGKRTVAALPKSSWQLVTATYDGSEKVAGMKLYINGVLQTTTTISSYADIYYSSYGAQGNTATKFAIGSSYYSGSLTNFFDGKIDSVKLFDKELSQVEVTALYSSGEGSAGSLTTTISATSNDAIDLGWHLVAATYNAPYLAEANGIILYVDGSPVDSTAVNDVCYVAMKNMDVNLKIGAQISSTDGLQYVYADKMDDTAIFGDVLTPAEIASLITLIPYEIETDFSQSELGDIQYAQVDNMMYIVDGNDPPQKLTREGHTTWTIADADIDDGPFLQENKADINITPSGDDYNDVGGSITLTSSEGIFKPNHVGSIWQLAQTRATSVFTGTLDGNESGTVTAYFRGGYGFTTTGTWPDSTVTLERSTDGGETWEAALSPLHGTNYDNPAETEVDGAIYRATMSDYVAGASCVYTFIITDSLNYGIVKITGYTSPTVVSAKVIRELASTDATKRWREGYWSDYRGWPNTVNIYQERLIFGGSKTFNQTLWFGRPNASDYEDFTEGADDSMAFTIALPGHNPIRWLTSKDYLIIGTSGSVGKYGKQGEALSPSSPSYQEQTKSGSAPFMVAEASDALLYIERGSTKVREFIYSLQSDKFVSPDLTVLASDILEGGVADVFFQQRPEQILWCVLEDGNMATMTYQREQEIYGWAKQSTDGYFESGCRIPGSGSEDEIWVAVKRTIDNNDVRYIEQFQPRSWGNDINACWFVDCAIGYDGEDASSLTGLNHLIGKDVYVLGDGVIEPNEVVDANGEITIDRAAGKITAGLPFTSKLETMPIYLDPMDKPYSKNILSLWFDFYKTGFCKYAASRNASKLININFENDMRTDPNATVQELYTSDNMLKEVTDQYGSSQKLSIYIESDAPLPLTLRSISYKVVGYPK
jgi:hypothetical protein